MDRTNHPGLLGVVRQRIRLKHYSHRTKKAYVQWIWRFVLFHGRRHPRDLGREAIKAFLTHLAVERHVAAATQNQALNALLFLYREVLGTEMPWLQDVQRARKPQRKRSAKSWPRWRAPSGCQGSPNFPQLWSSKIPHPRLLGQLMGVGSSARTSPALSFSLSR